MAKGVGEMENYFYYSGFEAVVPHFCYGRNNSFRDESFGADAEKGVIIMRDYLRKKEVPSFFNEKRGHAYEEARQK